jgi:hypothetical protein
MAAGNDGQPVVGTFRAGNRQGQPAGTPRFDYPQTLVEDLQSKTDLCRRAAIRRAMCTAGVVAPHALAVPHMLPNVNDTG